MTRTDAFPPSPADSPLRIAIISTPRSGNNWLMHLLGTMYDVPRLAPNRPDLVDWVQLPRRGLFLFHWHPEPSFLAQLRQHDCHLVGMVRHPLDVLLSVLHLCLHNSADWLASEAGDERTIVGALPCSRAFVEYATGPRAQALLSISREWCRMPGCHTVRYEDLFSDPHGELRRLVHALGLPPGRSIDEAIAATTLPALRQQHPDRKYHFWQGQPGLWRRLLPAAEAHTIAEAHAELFAAFGYPCDPDPCLDGRQADARWIDMLFGELAEGLPSLSVLPRALHDLRMQLDQAHERLAQYELGPIALQVAQRLRRLSLRYPRMASVVKLLVGQERGPASLSRTAAGQAK